MAAGRGAGPLPKTSGDRRQQQQQQEYDKQHLADIGTGKTFCLIGESCVKIKEG